MKKIETLKALMGRKMKHFDGREFMFHTYREEKGKITIVTNSEWLETTVFDIQVFLESFTEIPQDSVPIYKPEQKLPVLKTVNNETPSKLCEILLDNIEKVKNDRDYIPQASAISNAAQVIINLARLEIEMRTKL